MVTKSMDKASLPLPPIAEEKGGAPKEVGVVEPKIVMIDEEGGARIHAKKTPSQLPYLNRNPAI